MTAARLWWRFARAQAWLLVAAVVSVALASTLLATGARLFHEVAADDLIHAVDEGPEPARRIDYVVESRIGLGSSEPMERVREHGEHFLADRVSDDVAAVLERSQFVVDSAPYDISSFPDDDDGPFELSIALRYQEGIEDQLSLVAGAMPGEPRKIGMLRGPECPPDPLDVDGFVADDDVACTLDELSVHQVVLTEDTARDLLIGVGDRVLLRPQSLDPLWAPVFGSDLDAHPRSAHELAVRPRSRYRRRVHVHSARTHLGGHWQAGRRDGNRQGPALRAG